MKEVMDEIDAAETGRTSKRKQFVGGNSHQIDEIFLDGKSTKKMRTGKFSRIWIGIGAILTLTTFLVIFGLVIGLESGRKLFKIHKGGSCLNCDDLDIFGGEKFLSFVRSKNENGCLKLEIQCGLEKGTEAIIQWYNGDQNMGVSFMQEIGQSNVRRMVECNSEGQFELEENGHRGGWGTLRSTVLFRYYNGG